jgi:hypothetical protein
VDCSDSGPRVFGQIFCEPIVREPQTPYLVRCLILRGHLFLQKMAFYKISLMKINELNLQWSSAGGLVTFWALRFKYLKEDQPFNALELYIYIAGNTERVDRCNTCHTHGDSAKATNSTNVKQGKGEQQI